jgi:hypothetical protein
MAASSDQHGMARGVAIAARKHTSLLRADAWHA